MDAPSGEEPEIEPLTAEETSAILNVTAGLRNSTRWSAALALGLRQGEALGLRWRYVDLDKGELTVAWQLRREKWRHGCDDPHACGRRHHRYPCPRKCPKAARRSGCPHTCVPATANVRFCPEDCTGHAKACPQRHGGGLVFRAPKDKKKRPVLIPRQLVE